MATRSAPAKARVEGSVLVLGDALPTGLQALLSDRGLHVAAVPIVDPGDVFGSISEAISGPSASRSLDFTAVILPVEVLPEGPEEAEALLNRISDAGTAT